MAKIPVRPMGRQGLMASMQGYGCMGLTAFYGAALEEEEGVKVGREPCDLLRACVR